MKINFYRSVAALLGLLGMILFPAALAAQGKGTPGGQKADQKSPASPRLGGVIGPQLGLSARQEKNVIAIVNQLKQQAQKIAGNPELTEAQKQKQLFAIRENAKDQIADLLTPAQKRRLMEIRRRQVAASAHTAAQAGPPRK